VVADLRFRRALLHAIDRQQIVDTLVEGKVPVAHSYLMPEAPEHREIQAHIVQYDYNPRRAAEYLADLGLSRGSDGQYRDPTNQPLSVEVRGSTGTEIGRKAVFPVVSDWQRLGLAVDPVFPPPQRARDREYRATFPAFEINRNPNEPEGLRRYHSSNNSLPENNYSGQNRNRYFNAEFDASIDGFFSTIARPARMQYLGRVIHHMTDQLVVMGLFYDAQSGLVANRIQNVTGGGGNATQTWNAHEWDVI
jgi:peptide/nickel transport system substrate-binding protein